jgi:hypothetical protein
MKPQLIIIAAGLTVIYLKTLKILLEYAQKFWYVNGK